VVAHPLRKSATVNEKAITNNEKTITFLKIKYIFLLTCCLKTKKLGNVNITS